MTKKIDDVILLEESDQLIPLTVRYNSKKNVRFKFSSKGGGISMPPFLKQQDKIKFIEKGTAWTKEYLKNNPQWQTVFDQKKYSEGNTIKTDQRTYLITREHYKGKIRSKINGNDLLLWIPEEPKDQFKALQEIRSTIHKCISKDQKQYIEYLVDKTNDQTLKVRINNIRLKYNQSNWGSCSSNRNLSFSSRLLFAPEWVIISVIKHELAHFFEMNHSDAFWNLVKKIDPNYIESENWLRQNNWKCDF